MDNSIRAHLRDHAPYVLVAVLGLASMLAANFAGVWHTQVLPISPIHEVSFKGYSNAWNWLSLPCILVVGVSAIRITLTQFAGNRTSPPVISSLGIDENARNGIRDALSELRSWKTITVVFFVALLVNLIDLSDTLRILLNPARDKTEKVLLVCGKPVGVRKGEAWRQDDPYVVASGVIYKDLKSESMIEVSCDTPNWETAIHEPDWTVMALAKEHRSGFANTYMHKQLAVIFVAYLQQLCAGFLGIWVLWITFRHNRLYLSLVTNCRPGAKRAGGLIWLDFADPVNKFGLSHAHAAFSLSMWMTAVVGIALLASRWANSDIALGNLPGGDADFGFFLKLIPLAFNSLNDVGQGVLEIGFGLLLLSSLMPAWVKIRPGFMGIKDTNEALQTMMPSGDWKPDPSVGARGSCWPDAPSLQKKHIEDAIARLNKQFFWPSGSSDAFLYFSFVFYIAINVVVPVFSLVFWVETIAVQCMFIAGACGLAWLFLRLIDLLERVATKQ